VKAAHVPRLVRLAQQCLERMSELTSPSGRVLAVAAAAAAAGATSTGAAVVLPEPPSYADAALDDASLARELEAFLAEGLPDVPTDAPPTQPAAVAAPGPTTTSAAIAAPPAAAAVVPVPPLLPQVEATRFQIFDGPDVRSGPAAATGGRTVGLPPSPYLAYREQVQDAYARAQAKADAASGSAGRRGDLAETRRLLEDAQIIKVVPESPLGIVCTHLDGALTRTWDGGWGRRGWTTLTGGFGRLGHRRWCSWWPGS
jgi:hypothetical protein